MRPSIRTATEDHYCKQLVPYTIFYSLGLARHSRLFHGGDPEIRKKCFDNNIGYPALFSVIAFSFTQSLLVVASLLYAGLWKSKKYSHLFYLNVMNLVLLLGLINYGAMTQRELSASQCLLKLQILSISIQMYLLALVCLGIDCALAVFHPLKYRSMSTMKLFVTLNLVMLILMLVTQVIIPLIHVNFTLSNLRFHCEGEIFKKMSKYNVGTTVSSAALLLTAACVNLSIVFGVIAALLKRRKLTTNKDEKVAMTVFKLVFRALFILGGNYSCLSLIFLYPFKLGYEEYMPPTIILATAFLAGIWNNLIFVFLDKQVRQILTFKRVNK